MKKSIVKRLFWVALCVCISCTLLATFTPTNAAHAATSKAASCLHGSSEAWSPNSSNQVWAQQPDVPFLWASTCSGRQLALVYQNDGNLVLYIDYVTEGDVGSAIWATGTDSGIDPPQVTPGYVVFQNDGNFVIYNQIYFFSYSYQADWATDTGGKGATSLRLQADGNLVIYKNGNYLPSSALWASNTSGYA